ncbi:helix-turn-helix domain-containing protein [Cellulomonas soli]|uniref:Helix-turn-helix domain-containing protein n=1 Tax=Cellulomonas soli TaxID=931535 RepID=A0A512P8K9_9CELL|nr:helix-turn-helix domain-containing protein [Cellulomonas soli]NYI57751.1 excisionase family DNA binding protein [Cellulomonas soli]GEP67534.1 hypothetical protein CSO01_02490 [Cellulomonas soli]
MAASLTWGVIAAPSHGLSGRRSEGRRQTGVYFLTFSGSHRGRNPTRVWPYRQVGRPPDATAEATSAAQRLSIGRSLLYELMASGAIESVHIGRLRRIPVDCLSDFVDRRRREERDQPR